MSIMIRPISLMAICMTVIFSVSTAFGFPGRENQVPNNMWDCAICHVNPAGAGARTSFGEDIKSFGTEGGTVNWAGVCDRDSDGDGFTNGEELADPSCSWTFGDPNPAGEVTNPVDDQSFPEEQMMMVEAGEMMVEGGDQMTETGDQMTGEAAADDEGGCQSTTSRSPLTALSLLFVLFMMSRMRRGHA